MRKSLNFIKKQDLKLKTNKKSAAMVDFFVDEVRYINITDLDSG